VSHKEIKQSISELKGELEQTPKDTGLFESKLEQAKEEIDRYTPEAILDFVKVLQDEAEEFEVEHPRITALINNIMTSLSNLGI
jgi:chromosome segregation ATPase